ncbi:gliding motility-associated C-terminal domain-containing protein [Fulvivirgaceae bacterium BMA10]|uniref:Gliding motility-associated C-terminal domain-containing protein n=1 Tax=Splendidivirga corallicola TaxID=3051826 RepID=A0ABT8KKL4_9BACT|nr:gliding motility-associated C-terminal domain-containing protein [Fulvivirgaceae bacterium BMA10]
MKLSLKALLCTFLLLGVFFNAHSTHIVGGEFELIHKNDFNYVINLVIYFDNVNGNPAILQQENSLTAFIYSKNGNRFVQSVVLNKVSSFFVPYTNIDCAIGSLQTRRLLYTTVSGIRLNPSIYNDPEGYYIVWERCCRNNVISNVVLPAPNTVGQTFYLEFPPVVDENGDPFINSSPVLFPPLSDYACVNQHYYVDFAGSDPDGDSIVYSMENPLNSSTTQALPTPSPRPHPTVPWIEGIGKDNQVPGDPALSISSEGLLTVTPSTAGLFVFAVKAEEYRNGKKIGEVRRDFQMLVIDCPDPGDPPSILAKVEGETQFYQEGSVITFQQDDDPKCLEVLITDKDPQEVLGIRARAVNFDADVNDILSLTGGQLLNENDTLKAKVCLPDCPYTQDQPMLIDIIAFDDACSLPLSDTIRISVVVEPPINNDPVFTAPADKNIVEIVKEGEIFTVPIRGEDIDGDELELVVMTDDGFVMENFGMTLENVQNAPGEVTAEFVWDTGCDVYDFTKRQQFDLKILLNDLDDCMVGNPDTINLSLTVKLPTNNDPVVSSDLTSLDVTARIFETVDFTVFANDMDDDFVILSGVGDGFDMQNLGVQFAGAEGAASVSSPFSWTLDCDLFNLDQKDEFKFFFIALDQDKCKFPNADTLEVNVTVLPPLNETPNVFIEEITDERFEIIVGEEINLSIVGADVDGDSIYLESLEPEKLQSLGILFDPVGGKGRVTSTFSWNPECVHLPFDSLSGEFFEFSFVVRDFDCVEPLYDTLRIEVEVSDLMVTFDGFTPPNVFTPNGDGVNDRFAIPNIPLDNCASQFLGIRIYNRHGKLVFEDKKRDFLWDGKNMAAGVYYYHLEFTKAEYNGTVSILY